MALDIQLSPMESRVSIGMDTVTIQRAIREMASFVGSISMIDVSSHEVISKLWKRVKEIKKEVEIKKKAMTRPAQDQINAINDKANELIDALNDVELVLKEKSYEYHSKLAKDAEEEKRKIQEASETIGCFEPVYCPPAPEKIRTEGASSWIATVRKFRIVDEQQVPREYMMADEAQIKLAIKRGIQNIPGVEIYEEHETRLRSR